MQWQLIETAPRNGTKILAYCQPTHVESGKLMGLNNIGVVWWRGNQFKDSKWKWRHSQNDSAAEPTHWIPLPPPPKTSPDP